jgi:predicted Zn-dependent peptidase
MMLRMEDTRAVSAWMGSQQMVRGAILDVDDVVERVKAVTTEDLRRVASQNLVDDHLNLAVVGPCRGRKRLSKLLKL